MADENQIQNQNTGTVMTSRDWTDDLVKRLRRHRLADPHRDHEYETIRERILSDLDRYL